MKIYIVTDGCYSDYSIMGCFLDRDAAERFRRDYGYDDIEEHDTLDNHLGKGKMYQVYYYSWNGSYSVLKSPKPSLCDNNVFWFGEYGHGTEGKYLYHLWLRAADKDSALKIAHERIGAIIAMGDALRVGVNYTFPDYKVYGQEEGD